MANLKQIFQQISKPVLRDQIVTLGDLQEFKNDLLTSIKQLFESNKSARGKQWLKSYEVKKMLSISTGTLQHLRSTGIIPSSKIGGIVYYDLNEINKVLAGQNKEMNKTSLTPVRHIKS